MFQVLKPLSFQTNTLVVATVTRCTCICKSLRQEPVCSFFSSTHRTSSEAGCLATAIEIEKGRVGVAGNSQLLSEICECLEGGCVVKQA